MICPFLKMECEGIECAIYDEYHKECSLKAISFLGHLTKLHKRSKKGDE